MNARRLAGLLVLAWVVLGSGCFKPPPSRIGFNDKIAKGTRRLAGLGFILRKQLEPLAKGENVSAASISGTTNEMGKALDELQADFEELQLPGKTSNSAEAYRSAYGRFLETERKLYDTHIKKIVSILQGNLPPAAKKDEVDRENKEMMAGEQPALSALKNAQNKYAEEHNYKLVPSRAQ
jgi:hypothetical protein